MTESIAVGFQVFVESNGIGAVRSVDRQRKEIVIYVENAGDFIVRASSILSVHDEKVTLAKAKLEPNLLKAIGRSHAAEDR